MLKLLYSNVQACADYCANSHLHFPGKNRIEEARKGKTFISEKTSFRWSIQVVLLEELSPFFAVLRIRIGFKADPDPAFYLNADPDSDPDPVSQTNADPDPDLGQTLKAQKFEFLHETYSVPTYNRE
jgi:hypothetical protein